MKNRLRYGILLITLCATYALTGCQSEPAEKPEAKSTPMQISTPPPNLQVGAPK